MRDAVLALVDAVHAGGVTDSDAVGRILATNGSWAACGRAAASCVAGAADGSAQRAALADAMKATTLAIVAAVRAGGVSDSDAVGRILATGGCWAACGRAGARAAAEANGEVKSGSGAQALDAICLALRETVIAFVSALHICTIRESSVIGSILSSASVWSYVDHVFPFYQARGVPGGLALSHILAGIRAALQSVSAHGAMSTILVAGGFWSLCRYIHSSMDVKTSPKDAVGRYGFVIRAVIQAFQEHVRDEAAAAILKAATLWTSVKLALQRSGVPSKHVAFEGSVRSAVLGMVSGVFAAFRVHGLQPEQAASVMAVDKFWPQTRITRGNESTSDIVGSLVNALAAHGITSPSAADVLQQSRLWTRVGVIVRQHTATESKMDVAAVVIAVIDRAVQAADADKSAVTSLRCWRTWEAERWKDWKPPTEKAAHARRPD